MSNLPYEIHFDDVRAALEQLLGIPVERLLSVHFDLDEVVVEAIRYGDDDHARLFGTVTTRIPYNRDKR